MKIVVSALILMLPMSLFAEIVPSQTIDFSGGVDYDSIPTFVAPNRSPDQSNVIGDRNGAAGRRNGSMRFIDQAISTNPINSIYSTYLTSGTNNQIVKCLFATTGNMILLSTRTSPYNWIILSSRIAGHNQNFSFVTMNNDVIMTGDGLTDPIFKYTLSPSSLTNLLNASASSTTVVFMAKYLTQSKNYFLAGNVRIMSTGLSYSSTYYADYFYYSLLNQPSSMTAQRYIQYATIDGEGITGMGTLNDKVNVFKPSAIGELQWTLSLDLFGLGGDWEFSEAISGFGLSASKTLITIGQFYGMLSRDGYRFWDNRTRNAAADEQNLITAKYVKTPIQRLLEGGNYAISSAVWYPKRQWVILSYNDPVKLPANKINSVSIYDYVTGEWWPQHNILPSSFVNLDRNGDDGSLLFSDSGDGFVHYFDRDIDTNDSRKEKQIEAMESTNTWVGATVEKATIKEGAAAMKLIVSGAANTSTMTYMNPISAGAWLDGSKITKSDKMAFKVFMATLTSAVSVRIDLEMKDIGGAFDTNFTSITLSSQSFSLGWNTIELKLSTFPTRPDWIDLETESIPFADAFTYYGVRFVLTSTGNASAIFDDLRFVQGKECPLNAYRFTPMMAFGTPAQKNFSELWYTREKDRSSNLMIDVYNDFGSRIQTVEDPAEIPKEVFVFQYGGTNNITKLDSTDFSVKSSTYFNQSDFSEKDFYDGTTDNDYLYTANRATHSIVKILRSSMTGDFALEYGSLGDGTTNHNVTHQMAIGGEDDDILVQNDLGNNRVKANDKLDFSFLGMDGQLGRGTTNYHAPTGIAADSNNLWVANEGNGVLKKLSISTFGLVLVNQFDYDMVAEASLVDDEKSLYMLYNHGSPLSPNHNDVVLLRMDKNNFQILQKTIIRPVGVSDLTLSTYGTVGSMGILGKFVFVPFTDQNTYYIQKRLKSDFSLVKEYSYSTQFFSAIGDGLAYKPSLENKAITIGGAGKYLQLKFYDEDAVDNDWKLYNMTFLNQPESIKLSNQ